MYGRGPVSIDDVLSSREARSPLRLLDLSLISEGAAAMIVSSRVADCARQPIFIRGVAVDYVGPAYVDPPIYEELRTLGRRACNSIFRQAELTRQDIQLFSLYDPTSFDVLRSFELLGYCEEGEGGPFVEDGKLRLGGSHPTNLDGGLLSHAHLGVGQLTQKIKECVDQLRQDCPGRQVPDAHNAVITGAGGPSRFFGAALLSTDAG